jgi:hypothetical protein
MPTRPWRVALAAAIYLYSTSADADVYSDIREEALRANDSPLGHPLPVASHWTTGVSTAAAGWAPTWQMSQISLGHHLMPWFQMPDPKDEDGIFRGNKFETYARAAIQAACAHGLPLTLVATQWESLLSREPYKELSPPENPNVVRSTGALQQPLTLSPFGPLQHWGAVGRTWTTSAHLRQLQQWCPDPSMVIFLSNNEANKLDWTLADTDVRYAERYGEGQSADFKRQVVGDAWISRYRALQDGMRSSLTNAAWRDRAKFVGYNAFGPPHFGRWWGWQEYSQYRPGRIDPSPLAWDGGSPSYYVMNSTPETDYTVWSPQNEFQNLVFMQEEALALNPRFWFELSIWDGYVPGGDPLKSTAHSDNRAYYAAHGQGYTPERYQGYVQFGMWLNRPRAVREFRDWLQPLDANTEPYFQALMDAVDRVYRDPTLRSYWRAGRLLPVSDFQHPYQDKIPQEYAAKPRWFILPTSANGFATPGISSTQSANVEIRVFSLALEQGAAPNRTWMVYATSPLQSRFDIQVTIPGYGKSVLLRMVPPTGIFYEVIENSGSVRNITP